MTGFYGYGKGRVRPKTAGQVGSPSGRIRIRKRPFEGHGVEGEVIPDSLLRVIERTSAFGPMFSASTTCRRIKIFDRWS